MTLLKQYQFLSLVDSPNMVVEAMKLFGTLETPGSADNVTILNWAKEVGLNKVYSKDSVPWCGLFMAVVAKRAEKKAPKDPLWALNWAKFGVEVELPMFGDTLVFKRNGGGHVTIYVGEDCDCYHCLGGNQGDKVGIVRILKTRLYQARRPIYKIQPAAVKRVHLNADGPISENES